MAKCECCLKKHDKTYGSGRFCSQLCARSFSTKKNRSEISAKVSSKLVGRAMPESTRLKHVGFKHSATARSKISKSVSAVMTLDLRQTISKSVKDALTPERIERIRDQSRSSALKRSGNQWHTRRGVESLNERTVREYFEQHGIKYNQEVPCGQYSLDFVIVKRRAQVDIEIDGRQHALRKKSDEARDIYVKSQGYQVARFEMSYPRTDIKKREFNVRFKAFLRAL